MAQENNIALVSVSGTGPDGRIVKRDIKAYLASPSVGVPTLGVVDLGPMPANQVVPLSRLRGAIGRRMTQSKVELPHFYVTHAYDVAALLDVRKQVNTLLDGSGEKISINDFIVKAVALALRQYPNLNASLDGENIIRHGHVNVGVAVAVENGLLTVVTPDTDRKSLRMISTEIKEKAARVRTGRVHPDDITGSTFSVSNLGMFDVTHFTAIINPPEVAILAVGAAQQVPVVVNGVVKPGWRMNATVSIDHRVSDGAEAAQFMQALGRYLENPAGLLL
jgi:pyruvate dehydrogenase E2 component (dihydrolipoamide acetyltransferase)